MNGLLACALCLVMLRCQLTISFSPQSPRHTTHAEVFRAHVAAISLLVHTRFSQDDVLTVGAALPCYAACASRQLRPSGTSLYPAQRNWQDAPLPQEQLRSFQTSRPSFVHIEFEVGFVFHIVYVDSSTFDAVACLGSGIAASSFH